jgi:hypothetical protein
VSDYRLLGASSLVCGAFHVIFIGDDVRCVPDPIKFEYELNDYPDEGFYFLYHPAVFVYFLAFEMHHRLN